MQRIARCGRLPERHGVFLQPPIGDAWQLVDRACYHCRRIESL